MSDEAVVIYLNTTEDAEVARLKKLVVDQRRQLHILNDAQRDRNLQLDAMHYAWCTGGCVNGVHRFGEHPPLTEEIVAEAERNAKRLRTWFNSANFRISKGQANAEALKKKVA